MDMPTTAADPITRKNYFDRAQAFVEGLPKESRKSLPTITDASPNFAAWRQYFERHLGWTPWVLKLVLMQPGRQMTVPTEWPSWFDSGFLEDPNWRPVQDPVTPKQMRESLEQLRRRHGPNWGLKTVGKQERPPSVDRRALFGSADPDGPIEVSQELRASLEQKRREAGEALRNNEDFSL